MSLQIEAAQEQKEHPWLTEKEAERVAADHLERRSKGYEGDLPYTRQKLREQFLLMQEHCTDGSALMGCGCVPKKHLDLTHAYAGLGYHFLEEPLEKARGYAAEGSTIAKDEKEKKFYGWLAPWIDHTHANARKILDSKDREAEKKMWQELGDDAREIRKQIEPEGEFKIPNPASTRAYLPQGLTEFERQHRNLQHSLSNCIRKAELSCCGKHTTDYGACKCNPAAVCRASVVK